MKDSRLSWRSARAGVLVTASLAVMLLLPALGGAQVAGAGFTTTNPAVDGPGTCLNGPGIVNCNLYGAKEAVWINGGPTTGGAALSDGTYFFAVLAPSGQADPNDGSADLLSTDAYTERLFTVSGGDITAYLGATHDTSLSATQGLLIRLVPYSNTPNPGGVYIVALCQIDPATYNPVTNPVDPADCKYDAFKAPSQPGGPPPPPFGRIIGAKYYDANVNGRRDAGEPLIAGWPIDFTNGVSGTVTTAANGIFSIQLVADTYTFTEQQAAPPWVQTGNTVNQALDSGGNVTVLNPDKSYTVTVVDGGTTLGLLFGNVCLGAGGGHTPGFWSNQNGEAQLNDGGTMAPELQLLRNLNLVDAAGQAFDPTTYDQFQTWLLDANAVNMAYMLSVHFAAMVLNVEAGFVNLGSLVFAPDVTGSNAAGFITVFQLLLSAQAALAADGFTPAGDPNRAEQEDIKNALDRANNNLNFLQPDPASCPTPVFGT